MRYHKIVVGVDQSYKRTGIAIMADHELMRAEGLNLEKVKSNTEKRKIVKERVKSIVKHALGLIKDDGEVICLVERIRLVSSGFLSVDYIKSIAALNAAIVDVCAELGVSVFSVDTRAWKSQIVGTAKPEENIFGVDPKKWPTVNWCLESGYGAYLLEEVGGRKVKGTFMDGDTKYQWNDDIADAIGIASYGFFGKLDLLQKET